MNLILTDSGFGGLFICSELLKELARHFKFSSPTVTPQQDSKTSQDAALHITYVNAAPSNEQGYNDLKSKADKLKLFNQVLERMHAFYAPDQIFVACNSLSVLLDELPFSTAESTSVLSDIPIAGIVTQGKALLQKQAQSEKNTSNFFIFATETTISEGSYTRTLMQEGVSETNIVEQACPGLATEISNDVEGTKVAISIEYWVKEAIKTFKQKNILTPENLKTQRFFAFMGCTHYGSRKDLFQDAFRKHGFSDVTILDPNTCVVQELLRTICKQYTLADSLLPASVQFISPYPLPPNEVQTISARLHSISPETVDALQHYVLNSKLYGVDET